MLLQPKIGVCLARVSRDFSGLQRFAAICDKHTGYLYTAWARALVAYVFVANRRKPPQTAKIATYTSSADPNFRLQ